MLIRVGVLTLCLMIGVGPFTDVRADTVGEYTVKAALVLNLARFTDWPADAFADSKDAIVLYIVGDDAAGDAFASIEGRSIGGRRLVIKRMRRTRQLKGCHLLFVGGSDRSRLPKLFAAVDGRPVLTIGEMKGFAGSGGIVNLIKKGSKIRLQVNLGNAQRAGLKISSRILKLATIVNGSQGEERK